MPEFRARVESYPLWSLLTIVACAMLCGAQRGPKALAGFAKKLSQAQRRALAIRPDKSGWYPAPSRPTFSRLLQAVDFGAVDRVVREFQAQVRGQPPKEELVVLDGKQPKHGGGHSILTAIAVPSQHYLGSAIVDQKTNEIPVARQLFEKLALESEEQAAIIAKGVEGECSFSPGLRVRIVKSLLRVFGPRQMKSALAAVKVRGLSVYSGKMRPGMHAMPTTTEEIGARHKGAGGGSLRAAVTCRGFPTCGTRCRAATACCSTPTA